MDFLFVLMIMIGSLFGGVGVTNAKPPKHTRVVKVAYKLTRTQMINLKLAYKIGKAHNLQKTLMAIMMQETRAGVLGPVGDKELPKYKRSYGLMQVKIATARFVLRTHPKLIKKRSDWNIRHVLLHNRVLNIEIAMYYLLSLKHRGLNWRQMVTAYNQGYGGAKDINPNHFPYTKHVIKSVGYGGLADVLAAYYSHSGDNSS